MSTLENFLSHYESITVIANSQNGLVRLPKSIKDQRSLIVIFNNSRIPTDISEEQDILWVHRLNESTGEYFGFNRYNKEAPNNVYRLCITDRSNGSAPAWSIDQIASIYDMPNIEGYPIGRRVFNLKKKNKFITSPSTGFVVLSILNRMISSNHPNISVIAIGFGRLSEGYFGHAWRYERRMLSTMKIRFLTNRLQNDYLMKPRSLVPDFTIRIVGDISRKLQFKSQTK